MPLWLSLLLHNFQLTLMKLVMRILGAPRPITLTGPGCSLQMCQAIADLGAKRVLIVTDAVLVKIGLIKPLVQALEAAGVQCNVYDGIEPDPTHAQIEAAILLGQKLRADAVLAVGGGSPMDGAKVVAACLSNNVGIRELVGNFKVKKQPLPLFVIPTTAGTGSEVTVVAVVTDKEAQQKTPIVSNKLVPMMAALDPALMTGLPPAVTAATGMDALTHAIESYISRFSNEDSSRLASAATKMIFENLPRAFENGGDIHARQAMSIASMYAGLAFTQTSVGYVHAIAHNFGGLYHTPHGLANAIVLPHILDFSKEAAASRLAELAVRIGLGNANEAAPTLAQRFIDKVRELARQVQIPETLAALREQDIPLIAQRAIAETQGFYPVPRYMEQPQCEAIIRKMLP